MKQSPAKATFKEMCRMRRDNADCDGHWIMVDAERGTVTIASQKMGEPASQIITIPRKVLLRMARWYLKPQVMKASK